VAVVIPLDDSFPVRAEAAGCLFNALTGRPPGRTPNALTAQQRRRLGLVLRSLDGWLERCSYRQIAKVLFRPNSIPAGRGWKTHDLPIVPLSAFAGLRPAQKKPLFFQAVLRFYLRRPSLAAGCVPAY
jgi:hypothetical protein